MHDNDNLDDEHGKIHKYRDKYKKYKERYRKVIVMLDNVAQTIRNEQFLKELNDDKFNNTVCTFQLHSLAIDLVLC